MGTWGVFIPPWARFRSVTREADPDSGWRAQNLPEGAFVACPIFVGPVVTAYCVEVRRTARGYAPACPLSLCRA